MKQKIGAFLLVARWLLESALLAVLVLMVSLLLFWPVPWMGLQAMKDSWRAYVTGCFKMWVVWTISHRHRPDAGKGHHGS